MTKQLTLIGQLLILALALMATAAHGRGLPDFTDLVEETKPAVVNIEAKYKDGRARGSNPLDEFFRRFGGPREFDYQPAPSSRGTGFIISKDGYILTNRHVVTGADEILVRMQDGKEISAQLIGEDDGTDVALLKVDQKRLPTIEIGNSDKLKVGEWVLAIGAPFGFDYSVTAGIVSAKGRSLGSERYVPFIQTDVAINPGNSGGPLVDMNGKVVGINSQILSGSGGYMGLSFAIPIDVAMNIADQLKEHGHVKRGFIGVGYQNVDARLAESFGLDGVYGAAVTEIVKDGPADQAGFKTGDVIVKFGDKKVNKADDLPVIVGAFKPGSKVKVVVVRDGDNKTLTIEVGERATEEVAVKSKDNKGIKLGIAVSDIPLELAERVDETGVFVSGVSRGPAAEAGVRRGDIILSINREKVKDVDQFRSIVAELPRDKPVPMLVLRNGRQRLFLTLVISTE